MERINANKESTLIKKQSKMHTKKEKKIRPEVRNNNLFLKIMEELDGKNVTPLPPQALKIIIPESTTINEKNNYSVSLKKNDHIGDKKVASKFLNSKFKNTSLEEQSPPLYSSKGKRSSSPPSDSTDEKKTKVSSNINEPPHALLDSFTESFDTDKDNNNNPTADESTNNTDKGKNKHNIKGILVIIRNKSSNKSVSWKKEDDLEEVSYFENDPTERINVMKYAKIKMMKERKRRNDVKWQHFLAARKLNAVDNMCPTTPWRNLDENLLIDIPDERGKGKVISDGGSLEKMKQTHQERYIPNEIYSNRTIVPDSPFKVDQLKVVRTDPLIIPLDDVSGDLVFVYNYEDVPWPEPKGDQPPSIEFSTNNVMPTRDTTTRFSPLPVYDDNRFNRNIAPVDIMDTNFQSPSGNQDMLTLTNDPIYMDDQIPIQPQPFPQTMWLPQRFYPSVQEEEFMMNTGQYWDPPQLPINNGPPPGFKWRGGRGRARWNNFSGGYFNSFRGNVNRNNQRRTRGGPYGRRDGHLSKR